MENTIPHIESVEHGEYTPMVGISTNNIESSLDIQAQQARVEKRVSQLTTLIASADSDVGVGSPITYISEEVIDHLGNRKGAEILLRCEGQDTSDVLEDIKIHGKSLDLFYRGLLEVFTRIIKGETGNISLNAFVADIGHKEFRYIVRETMKKFKKEDRKRIVIEIGEIGFGEINNEFIQNIIWLKEQGFRLAIDDYDLLKMQGKGDISRKLLSVIGQYCEKIKLDYKTTAKIIQDPTLQRLILKHRMTHNHYVTAEGIHVREDIVRLSNTVKEFQVYKPINDPHYKRMA